MRLSDLGDVLRRGGDPTARIWRLLAYVGRYGHQPVPAMLGLTTRDLGRLAENVAELVRGENESGATPRED